MFSSGLAGGKDSGTSPSEVGSAVEFPARSEDPAVVLAYTSRLAPVSSCYVTLLPGQLVCLWEAGQEAA